MTILKQMACLNTYHFALRYIFFQFVVTNLSVNGLYFQKHPHSTSIFISEIEKCMAEHSMYTLQTSVHHIHHCLINKLYMCWMDYQSEVDIIYIYNKTMQQFSGRRLLHTSHQVLPSDGYHLSLCGLYGNNFPFVKPTSWVIKPYALTLIHIKWLKFKLPISKPRCKFSGIRLVYNSSKSKSNTTKEIFCGSHASWNTVVPSTLEVMFYHDQQIDIVGSYGFFAAYSFEDTYELYETDTQTRAYCTPDECVGYSMFHKSGWLQYAIATWHIKSTLPVRTIAIRCTRNLEFSNHTDDRFDIVFYDGPGSQSPSIEPETKSTWHAIISTSTTFQMFVLSKYLLSDKLHTSQPMVNCEYRAISLSLNDKSMTDCYPMQIQQDVDGRKKSQVTVVNNHRSNTACIWAFQLQGHHGLHFELPYFSFSLLNNLQFYEEDFEVSLFDSGLCLYGGLYIYELEGNEPFMRIVHWCPQEAMRFPRIIIDGGTNRKLMILVVSYQAYSSVQMLAQVSKAFITCVVHPNVFGDKDMHMLQSMVNNVYPSDCDYKGYNKFQELQRIANCLFLIYISGSEKVLHDTGKDYNISFTIPPDVGPSEISIVFDMTPTFPSQFYEVLLSFNRRRLFHPRVPTLPKTYSVPLGDWTVTMSNPEISANAKLKADIGIYTIVSVKIFNNLFCSDGRRILSKHAVEYFHHQYHQYKYFMIAKSRRFAYCSEILLTHFTPQIEQFSTEIYVKVTGHGSVVTISKVDPDIWLHRMKCIVNETILLYEIHSIKDTVYRYTFENTSTKTVTWHSIFDSDVYIHITQTLMTTDNTCPGYRKKVDVYYKTNISFALQRLPLEAKTVTHYKARYLHLLCY